MSDDGVRLRPLPRPAAVLTATVATLAALAGLAGCSPGGDSSSAAARQDIAAASRSRVAAGGTVHWALDAAPETLNAFQADADAGTDRIAGAVLPSLFRLDAHGSPQRNPDYLASAEVTSEKPKQVVVYELAPKARWNDGRPISAADFTAQWHALSGKDTAYWTARNAGYDRIEKVAQGRTAHEVRVTFNQPYADWRSLFTPLYPKQVMGSPDAFNDSARRRLKVTAGPFALAGFDAKKGEVTLRRDPHWWGHRAKLSSIVFREVPRAKRMAALAAGRVDVAEVDPADARKLAGAGKGASGPRASAAPSGSPSPSRSGSGAPSSSASSSSSPSLSASASGSPSASADPAAGAAGARARHIVLRKSLEPAYTQLALNGANGPLADERVRRAVARAIDRAALARLVLKPLGLPARPVGSHLALAGQDAYKDGSGALGRQDAGKAQALLADAGWVRGGPVAGTPKPTRTDAANRADDPSATEGEQDAADGEQSAAGSDADGAQGSGDSDAADDATGDTADDAGDGKPAALPVSGDRPGAQAPGERGAPGAYAPRGTAAPGGQTGTRGAVLTKKGKPLTLRFVLPAGPGSASLRAVGDRISRMLARIGIRTAMSTVADDSFFNDHIASGEYDLALYSWPASAFPATDARPIFAKPVPGADGSLNVEQNYTRIGTDTIDRLFDRALTELDSSKEQDLVRRADARIWAQAASIPLFQRPQLVAVRSDLANVGAFGFQDPRYEDIGFRKPGAAGAPGRPASGTVPGVLRSGGH